MADTRKRITAWMDTESWEAAGEALAREAEIDRSDAMRLWVRWLAADPRGALSTARTRVKTLEAARAKAEAEGETTS